MQHFHDIMRTFAALQIFFSIFLLKCRIKSRRFWKVVETWSSAYSITFFKLKNIFLLFSTCCLMIINVMKLNIEKINVLLLLSNVVNVNIEVNNVYSTLFNIFNFNVDIHNVTSTLIWQCPTSRRRINVTTTLKQCWNI